MKASDPQMMNILYAPAGYTHTSHLPGVFRSGDIQEKTLINFWLLRQCQLSALPDAWQSDDDTLSHLLASWHLIPAIAHLTGGYLLRNRLPEQSALLMSDARLLAFISLPLLHQVTIGDTTTPDIRACGAAFILGLFPELPTALRQRLLLNFPAGMALPPVSAPRNMNHINLLRMALTYAHHYY